MDYGLQLIIGSVGFVATHLLLSHLLRERLLGMLGAIGYQIVYSIIAFATLGLAIYAYRALPATSNLWPVAPWMQVVTAFLMFCASVLFVGSVQKNPAMPAPQAGEYAELPPHGVFKITRHPMMWAFALWAVAHILARPTEANLWLMGSVGVLALVGAAGQDKRKAKEMGLHWQHWQAKTSFLPFGKGLATPGSGIILLGIVVWLLASWAHHGLGYSMVSPWTNIWGVAAP
ncbi:NnrU family protein [Alterisphingorhabdus coralli]|uniref:NnrU family protein n=1 Tax=Alterisphingorhabdus coralli TaxID=3071408 RepID=A0AA97FB41_9SPHN|nr:NnrU family protein [Parasphingorhabdus sp. SCSIO 66989]WOE76523.1 NnrU family protein [Parasphingorhabdus sp. SCSIO 66989]